MRRAGCITTTALVTITTPYVTSHLLLLQCKCVSTILCLSQARRLYYEPNQGIYYQYDDETQEYSIHSKVDVTKSQVRFTFMFLLHTRSQTSDDNVVTLLQDQQVNAVTSSLQNLSLTKRRPRHAGASGAAANALGTHTNFLFLRNSAPVVSFSAAANTS